MVSRPNIFELLLSILKPESVDARSLDVHAAAILSVAQNHGVVGLIKESTSYDSFPRASQAIISKYCGYNVRRGLLQQAVQKDLDQTCSEKGVQGCLFKGLSIARDYYGSYELRGSEDIDVLVQRDVFEKLRGALLQKGWHDKYNLDCHERAATLERNAQWILLSPQGVELDMHTAVVEPYVHTGISTKSILNGVFTEKTFGLAEISKPYLGAVLLLHGAKHCWNRLILLIDIMRWHESLSPAEEMAFLRLVREFHLERHVKVLQALLRKLLNYSFSTEHNSSTDVPLLVRLMLTRVPTKKMPKVQEVMFHLYFQSNQFNRLEYIYARLFSGTLKDNRLIRRLIAVVDYSEIFLKLCWYRFRISFSKFNLKSSLTDPKESRRLLDARARDILFRVKRVADFAPETFNCLPRALTANTILRRNGYKSRVEVLMRAGSADIEGHAALKVDDKDFYRGSFGGTKPMMPL